MLEGDDATYVRRCLGGEQRAFEALVTKYEQAIFRAALRMLNDRNEAEDITQSTFVKAYENLGSYDPRYKFFSWLYRIGINESINALKQRHAHEELTESVAAGGKGPDELYADRELEGNIKSCLMMLKPEYRTVLVLNHYQELSYQEISSVLDIPVKTVKSRLFTARQMLREIVLKRKVSND